jgi:hypothetical protein
MLDQPSGSVPDTSQTFLEDHQKARGSCKIGFVSVTEKSVSRCMCLYFK